MIREGSAQRMNASVPVALQYGLKLLSVVHGGFQAYLFPWLSLGPLLPGTVFPEVLAALLLVPDPLAMYPNLLERRPVCVVPYP